MLSPARVHFSSSHLTASLITASCACCRKASSLRACLRASSSCLFCAFPISALTLSTRSFFVLSAFVFCLSPQPIRDVIIAHTRKDVTIVLAFSLQVAMFSLLIGAPFCLWRSMARQRSWQLSIVTTYTNSLPWPVIQQVG